jgi:TonB family protein
MSPAAVALAVLLHGLVALAIWWLSLGKPNPPVEDVIEVSIERPKPPEPAPEPPKPEPPPQPPQQQVAPPIEGLRPPADIVSDKPTQAPPKGDAPKDALFEPPPPVLQDSLPAPEPPAPPPTPAELARPEPQPQPPQPKPAPPPQQQALAPPATSGQLPKPPPPQPKPPENHALATPPAPPPPKPQPPKPPAPPTPQLQQPQLRPSPLTTAPTRRPPAGTQSENPSPSPFVNPADTYNRARVADNYLWQVVRKLQGYRYTAHVQASQGITVVRVVIARDGRLLNVTVTRSSGYPEFDNGVLAGVRSGSPYAPLPPDIKGDSATFDLPLVSVQRGY